MRGNSGSRSSQNFIEIPNAYYGPYKAGQLLPNDAAQAAKYNPPLEVTVTSKSSAEGSVERFKLGPCKLPEQMEEIDTEVNEDSGHGQKKEASGYREATLRRQVLQKSKASLRTGLTRGHMNHQAFLYT